MAPKPQNKAPQRAQHYADGGQVGLQPTLAIGYADGGSLDQGGKGPWTGDLNSKTTSFNQDWLRGPSFGDRSEAGLINYVPPTPEAAGGSPGSPAQIPTFQQPPEEQNPDGTTNPDAQGARINADLSKAANSPSIAAVASKFVPGLSGILSLGKSAYDVYQGATGGDFSADGGKRSLAGGLGSLTGPNAGAMGAGDYTLGHISNNMLGKQDPTQVQVEDRPLGDITQAANLSPAIAAGQPDDINLANAATRNSSSSWRQASGLGGAGENSGTGYNGAADSSGLTRSVGDSGSASAADGGMASPGGFQRAGQPGALPGAQPPGPPGLQMPDQQGPAAPSGPMHPALANLHVQNKLANPQVMQAIKAHIDQAIQSGQLNPQQLQMMGQLAQSAMQHPELWPKLRQFAIQANLPDAQKLPMQFDQGVCMSLIAASQASQHGDRPGAYADGGKINGPGTGTSDSIPAVNHSTGQPLRVANGEYIIPADVVATKGKEFFDNIVRKYHTPAAMQHGR